MRDSDSDLSLGRKMVLESEKESWFVFERSRAEERVTNKRMHNRAVKEAEG